MPENPHDSAIDAKWMKLAIELARKGEGLVEPNPMVGCVITKNGHEIGRGHHERFGAAHAEVNALRSCETSPAGATAYVSLEPCSHHGKTPPCSTALIDAGIKRVVVACLDPYEAASGRGVELLKNAGIEVSLGVLATEAKQVLLPFFKMCTTQQPWIIAKWAMSLDGRIATAIGDSQWISCEASRRRVHEWRGKLDAIMVGIQTALKDDPLLTARPSGERVAARVVMDSKAKLPLDSNLVRSIDIAPVWVVCGHEAPPKRTEALQNRGVKVLQFPQLDANARLQSCFDEMGRQKMTNLIVEGGGNLLGSLFAAHLVDEIRVFVAPMIIGGNDATSPVGGLGCRMINDATRFKTTHTETIDVDTLICVRQVNYF